MKASEIEVGYIYHEGKTGAREVVSINKASGEVIYILRAAKVESEYSYAEKGVVSLVGTEHTCQITSLASWAKQKLTQDEGNRLIQTLRARKTKLSTGEQAFMRSVIAEAEEAMIIPGLRVSYDHTEGRAVGGLERKGMLTRENGEAELTDLGAAWLEDQRNI